MPRGANINKPRLFINLDACTRWCLINLALGSPIKASNHVHVRQESISKVKFMHTLQEGSQRVVFTMEGRILYEWCEVVGVLASSQRIF